VTSLWGARAPEMLHGDMVANTQRLRWSCVARMSLNRALDLQHGGKSRCTRTMRLTECTRYREPMLSQTAHDAADALQPADALGGPSCAFVCAWRRLRAPHATR
jgi:hypothetical protein